MKVKDMVVPESATLPDYLGNVGVISSDMSSICNPGREVQTLDDTTASHPFNPVLQLGSDQRQAYDIITTHARKMIWGVNQEQLLMLLLGEGGMGKSIIISAVTRMFESNNKGQMLINGVYTGVVACHIGGCTLHTLVGALLGKKMPTQKHITDLVEEQHYLIIDKCSMIS